jgi:hypothetical protein
MEAKDIIKQIRAACDTLFDKYEGNPVAEDILERFEDIINDYYESSSPM